MAGIVPDLPDDTMSRTIVVTMMPDLVGVIEESGWEHLDAPTIALGQQPADAVAAAFTKGERVDPDPHLPAGVAGDAGRAGPGPGAVQRRGVPREPRGAPDGPPAA